MTEEVHMQAFREAVERRDFDALVALLGDEVVFRSPAVHRPYHGRPDVAKLLYAVGQVFEDFRYTHEIGAPDAAQSALVFRTRVGDRELEGCDFIHVGEDGKIDELFVMIRPLSGLIALAEAMSKQLGLEAAAAPRA
jgi:SnoaL-like domain